MLLLLAIIRKSVRAVLVTRSTNGGSGIAHWSERATQKPHAEYIPTPIVDAHAPTRDGIYISTLASTVASILTPIENFPDFRLSRKSVE